MNRFFLFALTASLTFLSSATFAQSAWTLSGQWRGTTHSPDNGKEIQFEVNLSEMNGTWKYFSSGRKANSSCLGPEFPLTVKTLPNGRWSFRVDGSSLLLGCPTFTLTLEQPNEQTLTGVFADGRTVALKKL
jgi:hypothetical protein